jgi:type II secretory pathway pseudopilin PulG
MRSKASARATSAFTLVEVSLILGVLGVLLAVAVPAFVRALRVSKVAEAKDELARIHEHAARYYASPQVIDGRKHLRCLPEPAGPTPASPSAAPTTADFGSADAPGASTWRALGYAPSGPTRFRYTFLPAQSGCGTATDQPSAAPLLTLRAEGDLDGDGKLSRFERTARDRDGELVLDELLSIRDRIE